MLYWIQSFKNYLQNALRNHTLRSLWLIWVSISIQDSW